MATLVMATLHTPAAYDRTWAEESCSSVKGSFAFRYAYQLTEEDLAWLERFKIVVTANVLPPSQARRLQRGRTKLFFYHWLTGFYLEEGATQHRAGSWESFVRHSRPHWLLNGDEPHAGPDGRGRAYYYDPSRPDLKTAWAKRLAQALRRSSYDGVFFDLVGSSHVPEELRKVHSTRHPDRSYDRDLSGFLMELKRASPKSLIFTNQAYRTPAFYLPAADYDLSESLMTSYAWGEPVKLFVEGEGWVEGLETFYRSWSELETIVNSIAANRERHNSSAKIFHLNYTNPSYRPAGRTEVAEGREVPVFRRELDRPALYYGYAAAKLWGHESYSPLPDWAHPPAEEVYFADLGKPLGEGYEHRDGLVRRYYQNGLVALNPALEPRTADLGSGFIPAGARGLWDCYEGKPISGFRVTIEPTVSRASGRLYPAGRVYLYRR